MKSGEEFLLDKKWQDRRIIYRGGRGKYAALDLLRKC